MPAPERAGVTRVHHRRSARSGTGRAGAGHARGRAVRQHAPPAVGDGARQRVEQRLPGVARVAEPLLAHVVAGDRAAQPQLAPQPHHRDPVGALAELAAQQRAPDLLPRLPSHPPLDPRARRHLLVGRAVAGEALQREHRRAHAHARERRERPEAEQVERRDERVQRAARVERDARGPPLDRVGHPELLEQAGDVAVGGEQVVVVALQPVAVADVERGRLAAEPGPALVDVDGVSGARQPAGCDEAADARAEHRDPHVVPARSGRSGASTLTRSRTT